MKIKAPPILHNLCRQFLALFETVLLLILVKVVRKESGGHSRDLVGTFFRRSEVYNSTQGSNVDYNKIQSFPMYVFLEAVNHAQMAIFVFSEHFLVYKLRIRREFLSKVSKV